MCGLAGFTSPSQKDDLILKKMISSLTYRGPDLQNFHINKKIAMGHSRLIILDPNGGHQPCVDKKSGNIMSYNGEIYNFNEISEYLFKRNIQVNANSDTDVLFSLLNNFGVNKALEIIDGMFAIAYFDNLSNCLYLIRDRFGEKPLYYYINKNRIFFASEPKAIFQKNEIIEKKVDQISLYKYLFFDFVPNPNTIFNNLKKVEPGEIIKFGLNNSFSKKKYFNHSNEFIRNKKTRLNKEILIEADKIINESIKERLVADVPVGVFLSGGLDSSLIAAIASKYKPNINCFTLKFDDVSYDESHYANLVTNSLKIKHNIFNINKKNLLKEWDNLNFYLDEPINDSSMLPTYILSKKSSDYVKVALTGDGCDELFAGYINFKSIFLSKLTQMIKEDSYIDRAFRSLIDKLPNSYEYMNKKFLLKQFSKTFGKNENLHSFYAMSSFSGNELNKILNIKIDEKLIFEEVKILDNLNKGKLSALENLQLQFLSFYLPDNILTKSDRSSMYNSIELRSPFLSNNLSKMSFNIEFNSKLKNFTSKFIIKKVAEKYLPNQIIYRKKHGFAMNTGILINDTFNQKIKDTINNKDNMFYEYLNNKSINKIIEDHNRGNNDHKKKIWSIFSLMSFTENLNV